MPCTEESCGLFGECLYNGTCVCRYGYTGEECEIFAPEDELGIVYYIDQYTLSTVYALTVWVQKLFFWHILKFLFILLQVAFRVRRKRMSLTVSNCIYLLLLLWSAGKKFGWKFKDLTQSVQCDVYFTRFHFNYQRGITRNPRKWRTHG
jgi:hypothetical protein